MKSEGNFFLVDLDSLEFFFFFFILYSFIELFPQIFDCDEGKLVGEFELSVENSLLRVQRSMECIYILFFSEILTINNSHFIKKLSRAIVQWIALEYFHESPIVYDNSTCKI